MAFCRLFVADAEVQLTNKGFLICRRWFCSETLSSPLPSSSSKKKKVSKKTSAVKDEKAESIRSFVEGYMVAHPGVFPKAKEVHEKVGGSLYLLKNILTEMKSKMPPNSGIDKQSAAESTLKAIELEEITDSDKLDSVENGFELLTETLGMTASRTTKDKDSGVLAVAKILDKSELPASYQPEQSRDGLTSSATVPGQQLSHSTNPILKEEENTRPISDMPSADIKLTVVTSSGNGDANRQAPNHNCTAKEIAASEMKEVLFDFFKGGREKGKEFNSTKSNASKLETSSDMGGRSRHVTSLIDIFKRNQKDSGEDNPIVGKLERDGAVNPKEERGQASERLEIKDLLNRIIGISKDTQNPGSWATKPSNETNSFNGELRSFVNGSMKRLSSSEDNMPIYQVEGSEVPKAEQIERAKPHEANASNLLVEDNRRQEKQANSHETENRMFQLDKNEKTTDDSGESDSDVTAFDYLKPEPSDKSYVSFQGPNLNATLGEQVNCPQHLLLVKFLLKTAQAKDISLAFSDCGPISEVRIIHSRRENRFNYAYVSFKTEEGLIEALNRDDMTICGADVVMEAAPPFRSHNKVFSMEQIKGVDFPVTFMKRPSRTVLVQGLADDLSFHSLRQALSSFGSVCHIAMGSFPSNVYAEFKSEESKERALAQARISISGSTFSIFRIDAPKTTVVRISNVKPLCELGKVHTICNSYGRVKRLVKRDDTTFDVHFTSSEWTNMVKILNRLNGLIVNQHQWIAQPATILPREVLQVLWNKQEGRRHVREIIQSICRRIEENCINTASVLSVAQTYCEH